MDWLTLVQTPFFQQIAVLCILSAGLLLFIRDRVRYDVVALLIITAIVAAGVLSPEEAFANFGHPTIIVVACMFVMSEAFVRSGIIDAIVYHLGFLHRHPIIALGVLIVFVTILSAVINNAGALAIAIPIAVHMARKSRTPIALFLLPLAFASHLGGFMTLIGTPRNIIISDFRLQATGTPFAMFDFFPVGGTLALLGVLFLILLSWRFIPLRKRPEDEPEILRKYTTEVIISPLSKVALMSVGEFKKKCKHTIAVNGVYREGNFIPATDTLGLLINDHLIIVGDTASLTYYTEHFNLSLSGKRAFENNVSNEDDHASIEAVVPPYTKLVGQDWDSIPLRERFGTNFLGIFRPDTTLTSPLAATRVWPNDIILLQGRRASIEETIRTLRLLPIASENISFGRMNRVLIISLILLIALVVATLNLFSLPIIFLLTCLLLITTNLISLRQAYESIDQTVIILLAGMITLGTALEQSGAAASIANIALQLGEFTSALFLLITVLLLSAILSDLMNATASVVTMAPIAILLAESLDVSIDPFLMAVAIGGSCAFLTPVGHESNAMVMKRGGYTFTDYFRVGLPLELLILASSVPLILHFWPF